MKQKPSNPVLTEEVAKKLYACVNCGKQISQFYGVWGLTGTCSRKCELVQEAKPRDFGEPKRSAS